MSLVMNERREGNLQRQDSLIGNTHEASGFLDTAGANRLH